LDPWRAAVLHHSRIIAIMGQHRMEKLLYDRREAMAALGIGNTKLY